VNSVKSPSLNIKEKSVQFVIIFKDFKNRLQKKKKVEFLSLKTRIFIRWKGLYCENVGQLKTSM